MADTYTLSKKRSKGTPRPTFDDKPEYDQQSSLCVPCQNMFKGELVLGKKEESRSGSHDYEYVGAFKLWGTGDWRISEDCHICFFRARIIADVNVPNSLVLRYLILPAREQGDFFMLVFSYSRVSPEEKVLDSSEDLINHELSLSQFYHGEPREASLKDSSSRTQMEYPTLTASNLEFSQFPPCQIETEDESKMFHRRQTLIDPGLWQAYREMVQQTPACREASYSTNSDSTWATARFWIKNCIERHDRCQVARPIEVKCPTRLVMVDRDARPRVVSGAELAGSTPYTTLSHRWGSQKFLTLTSSSLDVFRRGIPDEALTPTFIEAMVATARLGYQYIWIDSLCIIQDSTADWSAESQKMSDYYSSAVCNLAASKGSNDDSGCFVDRHPFAAQSCVVRERWTNTSPQLTFYVHDALGQFRESVYDCQLGQRGWVFQETLLAPRVLYFGHDQVFWDCLCLRACEAYPTHWIGTSFKNKIGQMPTYMFSDNCPRKIQLSSFLRWESVVEEYAGCDLTFPEKDKLVALSGVARAFGNPADYLAGLWPDDIAVHLLWQPIKDSKPYSTYIAPSWSWACMDGGVTFGKMWDDQTFEEQYQMQNAGSTVRRPFRKAWKRFRESLVSAQMMRMRTITAPFASLAGAQINLAGDDPMGRIDTASRINLACFPFRVSAKMRDSKYDLRRKPDGSFDDLPPIEDLVFLPLRMFSLLALAGLMLVRTDNPDQPGEYQRLGLFEVRSIWPKMKLESLSSLHRIQHRLLPLDKGDYLEKTGATRDGIDQCVISII